MYSATNQGQRWEFVPGAEPSTDTTVLVPKLSDELNDLSRFPGNCPDWGEVVCQSALMDRVELLEFRDGISKVPLLSQSH